MSIKPWQERVADENTYWGGDARRTDAIAMQAEIDELRAALAAQPVLAPKEVLDLYNFMDTAFVALTSQQEQIMMSLEAARITGRFNARHA